MMMVESTKNLTFEPLRYAWLTAIIWPKSKNSNTGMMVFYRSEILYRLVSETWLENTINFTHADYFTCRLDCEADELEHGGVAIYVSRILKHLPKYLLLPVFRTEVIELCVSLYTEWPPGHNNDRRFCRTLILLFCFDYSVFTLDDGAILLL
jgi:hypothetical protein